MATTAQSLLVRASRLGWAVELSGFDPRLVRSPTAKPLPPDLLALFKQHRTEIVRHLILSALIVRSVGKVVYGFDSDDGRIATLTKSTVEKWDRVCVEGDSVWVELPRSPEWPKKKKGAPRKKKKKCTASDGTEAFFERAFYAPE